LGITTGALVIVWLEREISTSIPQHTGPQCTGPLGILEALADGIKLLLKENLLLSRGDTCLFSIGPSIVGISILQSYSVIPFGYRFILADLSIGFFNGLYFEVLLQLNSLCQDMDQIINIPF